jgi:recombination protein RecA
MPTAKQLAAARNAAMVKFEERFAKNFGEGTLVGDEAEQPYLVIPTGSIDLDLAFGVGGWVRGRLAEIWGKDDLGKTTLGMMAVREAQRIVPDLSAFWVDMEQKWDWPWARTHGIITTKDRFRLYLPDSAEDVADAIKEALRSGLWSIIVLDSIGAMIPEIAKEKDANQAVMMKQAQIVTRMVQIAAVEARKSQTAVLMLNQVRADTSLSFKTTTTGGGFSLKHCSTQKVELKSGGSPPLSIMVDGVKQQVGHQVAAFVERNKVGVAKKTAFFTLISTATEKYGPVGIDRCEEAATVGMKTGVIAQSGGSYTFTTSGEKVIGRPAVVAALRADPELVDAVREAALATVAGEVITGEEAEPDLDNMTIEELVAESDSTIARLKADKDAGTGIFRKHGDLQ